MSFVNLTQNLKSNQKLFAFATHTRAYILLFMSIVHRLL